jgi:HPr kinase/phosphorylase
LALCGFFSYFAEKRIQVLGSRNFPTSRVCPSPKAIHRCQALCEKSISVLVVARQHRVPEALFRPPAAEDRHLLYSDGHDAFHQCRDAGAEFDFAPRKSEYGSMVDIQGIGVMVRGRAALEKASACSAYRARLFAGERRHHHFRLMEGRSSIGKRREITRNHMEVRWSGCDQFNRHFRGRRDSHRKALDLVVTLKDWQEIEEIERTGLEQEYYEIMGMFTPQRHHPGSSGTRPRRRWWKSLRSIRNLRV